MASLLLIALCVSQTLISVSLAAPQLIRDGDHQRRGNSRTQTESTPYRLSQGMNSFASNVYDVLNREEHGNILFSPFSLHIALAMTYFGSGRNSQTRQELESLLGLSSNFEDDYAKNFLQLLSHYDKLRREFDTKVRFANKIYTDDGFTAKEQFLETLNKFFLTTQEEVDFSRSFEAASKINEFVEAKTEGLIRDLISGQDINALTRMILINAIYFKANWLTQFQPEETKPGLFRINGETFNYPSMMNVAGRFGMANHEDFDILDMPYEDRNISMLVILPKEDVNIRTISSKIANLNFADILRDFFYQKTVVQFPKFKTGFKAEMQSVFKKMGLRSLFREDQADLSEISDEPLAVSKIIHQANVEVNEEGSEAAAATSIAFQFRLASADPEPREFIVDRPFSFIIHDRSLNVPLFMGRIVDPSGQRTLRPRQTSGISPQPRDDLPAAFDNNFTSNKRLNCTEMGYDNIRIPNVSFPCKGHDTFPLRDHAERRQKEQEQQQRDRTRF